MNSSKDLNKEQQESEDRLKKTEEELEKMHIPHDR